MIAVFPLAVAYLLIVLSNLIQVYDSLQRERSVIDRPPAWAEAHLARLGLVWIALLLLGLYLGFRSGGIIHVALLLALYFIVLPPLDRRIKSSISKRGR